MLGLPDGKKERIKFVLDLAEKCNSSQASRAAFYRAINVICNTGRDDGKQSLVNLLYNIIDRWAANLFSPTDLRFTIDFENEYDRATLDRAKIVARILTRDWERTNTDMLFAAGVQDSGKYGAMILKQIVQQEGPERVPVYHSYLIQPWKFGVYQEDLNDLSQQAALCETTMLSLPQVWRRIWHLPEAEKLFHRIAANAKAGQSAGDNQSFFHQVLSTSILNTTGITGNPTPGGIVQFGNNATFATIGPEVAVDLVKMYELWIQDENDYTTVQLIEPDILIAPYGRKMNLLIPGDSHSNLHPYTLIQGTPTPGYLWGRSELTDLIPPQGLLSQTADDVKRLFGMQVDKLLGFQGYDGLTDEVYDDSREAGYFNGPPGATITDLTPKFPEQALPLMKMLVEQIYMLAGMPDIMRGQGESGVRTGVHANTLLKTASPRMRQQSLMFERQCASAADLRLSLMEAKDPRNYWTRADKLQDVEKTQFKLSDIPEDRRVSVDSHSSSPIFADDHQQMVAFGLKSGFVTKHGAIDLLPLPQKELLHSELRAQDESQAAQMQKLEKENPELAEKLALKRAGGHR